MHNASKVLLGTTKSNHKDVSNYNSDPATYKAGYCVSVDSNGVLSLLKSAGMRAGVSLGKDLSDTKRTSVLHTGEGVPVRAALKRSTGLITVTSVANLAAGDTVTVGATGFVGQGGAATPGAATFEASGSTSNTATNLAAQINAHATANTLVWAIASGATVRLYSKVEGAGSGHDVILSYTDASPTSVGATLSELSDGKLAGGTNTISSIAYASPGKFMYINDVTGKADIAMTGFSTISNAVYRTGGLSGVEEGSLESESLVAVVVVDMVGGL